MRIVRQRAPERFTVVDNDVLEDARISFRAVGVLSYLLSRPDGWETNSEHLARERGHEGRDAIRTVLRELEAAGYLARKKIQAAATGRWSTVIAIVDRPTPGNPSSGPRRLENRQSVSQALSQSNNQITPPPIPTTGEEVEIPVDVHELAAELRTHRVAAGHPVGRWTARAVRRAIDAAVAAGYRIDDMPAALMSIALDPATQTPGRLAHDGPWWTDAEIRRRNAERAEIDDQRRRSERAAQAALAADDARRAADCFRCEGTGRTRVDVNGRAITAICTHGLSETESA